MKIEELLQAIVHKMEADPARPRLCDYIFLHLYVFTIKKIRISKEN